MTKRVRCFARVRGPMVFALVTLASACEPVFERYICIDVKPQLQTIAGASVGARGKATADFQDALQIVDEVANQWQFRRFAHHDEQASGFDRKYGREAHVPGERGTSLVVNAKSKTGDDILVGILFFRGSDESDLMREVRLELTERFTARFGAESITVANDRQELRVVCTEGG